MFQKYRRPLAFIFASYKKHKKIFIVNILGRILEIGFSVGLPLLAKLEMDQLAEKNEKLFGIIEANSFHIFIIILIVIFVGEFLQNVISSLISYFSHRYKEIQKNDFNRQIFLRIQNSTPGIFLSNRNKHFINKIIFSSGNIGDEIQDFSYNILTHFITFLGISGILISIDWKIFLVLSITTVVMFFLNKYKEIIDTKHRANIDYSLQHTLYMLHHELQRNLTQIISMGGLKKMINILHEKNEEYRINTQNNKKSHIIIDTSSFVFDNIASIFIKLIVGYSVFAGSASIGTMTMTLMYIYKMENIFYFLNNTPFKINNIKDDLQQFDIFLDLTEKRNTKQKDDCDFDSITFKKLSFRYPNSAEHEMKFLKIAENRIKRYKNDYNEGEIEAIESAKKELSRELPIIISNINLHFEIGKTYGIVGKNGAGKTTIISLLQGFFDNYSGEILFGKTPTKELSRTFFEENIAIINQVPYIIENLTIRENLVFGSKKEHSDAEIFDLLRKFGLEEKVKKQSKGLDSYIGYDGDFSGGEKQLLALIRVILQDKKILIMDEGTNQLDAENEMIVMNELLKHKNDKIVIFITHRMTTIRKADMIFCIKNGKIETSGTPEELLKSDNMYSAFWKIQVEK